MEDGISCLVLMVDGVVNVDYCWIIDDKRMGNGKLVEQKATRARRTFLLKKKKKKKQDGNFPSARNIRQKNVQTKTFFIFSSSR